MIELGKVQELEILRTKDFGVYVGEQAEDEPAVLLPKKQVPEGAKIGDKVKVFIYKDSSDRLIATTGMPKLQVGEGRGKDGGVPGHGTGEGSAASL